LILCRFMKYLQQMNKQSQLRLHQNDFHTSRERSEEDSYCDVTITVDGQQFQGHRCILSKFSKMLHKLFKTEVIEFLALTFDVKIC